MMLTKRSSLSPLENFSIKIEVKGEDNVKVERIMTLFRRVVDAETRDWNPEKVKEPCGCSGG